MKTQEQVEKYTEEKFKRTFGVDRNTFQVMLSGLEEQYKFSHRKGGRRPKLKIFDRLCIFFAYYRDYRTFEDIANDYSVATSTVFDAISLLENALNGSGKFMLPKREELTKNPPELIIIDTTEVEIEQPKKGFEYYSGKKRHTVKAQIITDYKSCNILSVDFSGGKSHDFALFKTTCNIISEKTLILADKGYQGIAKFHKNSLTPIKRFNKRELSPSEKWYNKIVSQSRAIIERINRRLKVFRILSERFRNKLSKFERVYNKLCKIKNN